MRKILVVITTGFVSWGGLTTAFMNYFRAMDKEGLSIDVASMNEPDKELRQEIETYGGKYIRLPDKRKTPVRYLAAYMRICGNYDVVHIHGNSPTMAAELLLARLSGVKIRIAHSHNTKGMHPIMNAFLKPVFNRSYTVGVACSLAAGEWLYGKHQFTVLKNVIDTRKYAFIEEDRISIRKEYDIKEDVLLFGTVGKFVEQKNHLFLIDLFKLIHKKNPDTKLLLVGDGSQRKQIEERIAANGLRGEVILAGMQSDIGRFYSAMDMYLLPSIYEGLCLALLEAQANGLFCYASAAVTTENDVTGNVDYIELDLECWEKVILSTTYKWDSLSRKNHSKEAIREIISKGYDNMTSGQILRKFYINE